MNTIRRLAGRLTQALDRQATLTDRYLYGGPWHEDELRWLKTPAGWRLSGEVLPAVRR